MRNGYFGAVEISMKYDPARNSLFVGAGEKPVRRTLIMTAVIVLELDHDDRLTQMEIGFPDVGPDRVQLMSKVWADPPNTTG